MKGMATMALFALGVVTSGAAAQARNDDNFSWSGRVAAGGTVRVHNLAGSINVERSGSGQVEVTGQKNYRRGDAADVRFEVVPSANGVTICAIWYDGDCTEDGVKSERRNRDDNDRNRNNDVSVTFTVRVPAGVKIDASGVSADVNVTGATAGVSANSVSGNVTLNDVTGDIRVNSVSGDVKVSGASTGSIHANSVSGDVEIGIDQLSGSGDLDFSTVSGDVDITFPANLDALVQMSTVSGELRSDFPLTTQGDTDRRNRNIEARIGSGGRTLKFHSVSGNVTLRRG
jgi:hypothetical protein